MFLSNSKTFRGHKGPSVSTVTAEFCQKLGFRLGRNTLGKFFLFQINNVSGKDRRVGDKVLTVLIQLTMHNKSELRLMIFLRF